MNLFRPAVGFFGDHTHKNIQTPTHTHTDGQSEREKRVKGTRGVGRMRGGTNGARCYEREEREKKRRRERIE